MDPAGTPPRPGMGAGAGIGAGGPGAGGDTESSSSWVLLGDNGTDTASVSASVRSAQDKAAAAGTAAEDAMPPARGGRPPHEFAAMILADVLSIWQPALQAGSMPSAAAAQVLKLLQQVDAETRPHLWMQAACARDPMAASSVLANTPQNAEYYRTLLQSEAQYLAAAEAAEAKADAGPTKGRNASGIDTATAISTSIEEIGRDVTRTMAEVLTPEEQSGPLRRILVAFVIRNAVNGYTQGMNNIAGALLYGMRDEYAAFRLLCWLLENPVNIGEYYDPQLTGLHVDLKVVDDVLKESDPGVSKHIAELGMDTTWFLSNILMSACINVVPCTMWLPVWDLVMVLGHGQTMIGACMGFVMGLGKELLLSKSSHEAMTLIAQHMHAWQTGDLSSSGRDVDFLRATVSIAATLPVAKLSNLRAKHRPEVLKTIAATRRSADSDDDDTAAGAGAGAGAGTNMRSSRRLITTRGAGLSQLLWLQRSMMWVSRMLRDTKLAQTAEPWRLLGLEKADALTEQVKAVLAKDSDGKAVDDEEERPTVVVDSPTQGVYQGKVDATAAPSNWSPASTGEAMAGLTPYNVVPGQAVAFDRAMPRGASTVATKPSAEAVLAPTAAHLPSPTTGVTVGAPGMAHSAMLPNGQSPFTRPPPTPTASVCVTLNKVQSDPDRFLARMVHVVEDAIMRQERSSGTQSKALLASLQDLQDCIEKCRDAVPCIAYTVWVLRALGISASAVHKEAETEPMAQAARAASLTTKASGALKYLAHSAGIPVGKTGAGGGGEGTISGSVSASMPVMKPLGMVNGSTKIARSQEVALASRLRHPVMALLLFNKLLDENTQAERAGYLTHAQCAAVCAAVNRPAQQLQNYLRLELPYLFGQLREYMALALQNWRAQANANLYFRPTAAQVQAQDSLDCLTAIHSVCGDASSLCQGVPRIRRTLWPQLLSEIAALANEQQSRAATETLVAWILGELEHVKNSLAPYKPASAPRLPLNLAHALQWQLHSLYQYVTVLADGNWRMRLVVVVQTVNAELHALVEAAQR